MWRRLGVQLRGTTGLLSSGPSLKAGSVRMSLEAPNKSGQKFEREEGTIAAEASVESGYLCLGGRLLHPLWLRNHCLAPSHAQISTKQRLFELTDLSCTVSSVQTVDVGALKVHFSDGHVRLVLMFIVCGHEFAQFVSLTDACLRSRI